VFLNVSWDCRLRLMADGLVLLTWRRRCTCSRRVRMRFCDVPSEGGDSYFPSWCIRSNWCDISCHHLKSYFRLFFHALLAERLQCMSLALSHLQGDQKRYGDSPHEVLEPRLQPSPFHLEPIPRLLKNRRHIPPQWPHKCSR